MYTREITSPPEHIIHNGKPVFGTFSKPFKMIDIRGIRHPYGNIPFPQFVTHLRIRSTLTFAFISSEYIGMIDIFDAKIFSNMEVNLWHIKTGKRFTYRKEIGPRYRFVPKSLDSALCVCFSRRRYVRISWNRAQKRFSLLLNLAGNSVFPPITAAFTLKTNNQGFGEIFTVTPAPITRRCSALYQFAGPLKGSLSINSTENYPAIEGLSYFNIERAYYKLRSKYDYVLGLGFLDGKQISFRLYTSTMAALDEDSFNHNVLFINGAVTPLPPVKITKPEGTGGNWIIQDTESMVDLTFTPLSESQRKVSLVIIRAQYHTVFGTFTGMIKDREGNEISLKAFTGIGKKMRLRV